MHLCAVCVCERCVRSRVCARAWLVRRLSWHEVETKPSGGRRPVDASEISLANPRGPSSRPRCRVRYECRSVMGKALAKWYMGFSGLCEVNRHVNRACDRPAMSRMRALHPPGGHLAIPASISRQSRVNLASISPPSRVNLTSISHPSRVNLASISPPSRVNLAGSRRWRRAAGRAAAHAHRAHRAAPVRARPRRLRLTTRFW